MLDQKLDLYFPDENNGTHGALGRAILWDIPTGPDQGRPIISRDKRCPTKEFIRTNPLDGPPIGKWMLGAKPYSTTRPVFELSRFNIDSEILTLTNEDPYLQLVLSRILPNLEATLRTLGKEFKIRVETLKDKEMPDWRNANIIAEIDDDNFDEVLNLWERASEELRELLKSLGQTDEIPQTKATDLNKFINITFMPTEA
ncbi:MAG: hypothetical protein QG670_2583 [Thermoproteota archaeon]|nr:hypothetical protein [Thermoproteota archaeon]